MRTTLPLLLSATLALASETRALQDAPPQPGATASDAYRPGHRVREEFTLPDVNSRAHVLVRMPPLEDVAPGGSRGNEVAGGLTTVLVFWSLRDPTSHAYVLKLEELQRELAERKVSIFLVASNHDEITAGAVDPLKKIRDYVEKERVTLPILIDVRNKLADRFGAVCANHAFVVGADRVVKYAGGIDDDPQGKLERGGYDVRHYLLLAIESTLAGTVVEHENTRPSGRPIKRAPEEKGDAEKGR